MQLQCEMQIDLQRIRGYEIHTHSVTYTHTHTNSVIYFCVESGKRQEGNENGIESFRCLSTIKCMQHTLGRYCLKPTAHALCGFVQVGNGKNRKEVERKFSAQRHTHTRTHEYIAKQTDLSAASCC